MRWSLTVEGALRSVEAMLDQAFDGVCGFLNDDVDLSPFILGKRLEDEVMHFLAPWRTPNTYSNSIEIARTDRLAN